MSALSSIDRAIVEATQAGLPLVVDPYAEVARAVGTDRETVMARLRAMTDSGAVRRIGAVPNHYRLGYRANGMTVWNVDDASVDALGQKVGALPFVSHCYRRPRHHPIWPYNLFAMVHAHTREEALEQVEQIASVLGEACSNHDVLYSTRILKKTGLRLTAS